MPEIAVTRPETLCIPHRLSSWTYPDMRANRVKSLSKYRVHSELPQAALVRLSPAVRDWNTVCTAGSKPACSRCWRAASKGTGRPSAGVGEGRQRRKAEGMQEKRQEKVPRRNLILSRIRAGRVAVEAAEPELDCHNIRCSEGCPMQREATRKRLDELSERLGRGTYEE